MIPVGLLQNVGPFFMQECVVSLPFPMHDFPLLHNVLHFWIMQHNNPGADTCCVSWELQCLCSTVSMRVFLYLGNSVQIQITSAAMLKKIPCLCSPALTIPPPTPTHRHRVQSWIKVICQHMTMAIHAEIDWGCEHWARDQDEQSSLMGRAAKRAHCRRKYCVNWALKDGQDCISWRWYPVPRPSGGHLRQLAEKWWFWWRQLMTGA